MEAMWPRLADTGPGRALTSIVINFLYSDEGRTAHRMTLIARMMLLSCDSTKLSSLHIVMKSITDAL